MTIEKSEEYKDLIPLYISRGLEIEGDFINQPIFSLIMKNDNEIIGAATCSKIEESYIVEAIVIVEKHEKKGYGTKLLNNALKEIHNLGGENIYLVAKNPAFFVKNNFKIINKEEAPNFTDCFMCSEFKIKCFPEVMKYVNGEN